MGRAFKEMTGALFPGQGSEREGMLSVIREDFRKKYSLLAQQELNTQQGIYAVSASLWEDSKNRHRFTLMAGHSLGFYSALYAAGCIDFETGIYLIIAAHNAISEVSGNKKFGMTAIIGIKWDIIEDLCRGFSDIYVANINSATQVVVSGSAESLEAFEKKICEEGALKVLRLPTGFPLHTPFLEGTSELMKKAIQDINIRPPLIPIIDHTTSERLTTPEQLKETLTGQFTKRVVWRDVIKKMWQHGTRRFIEIGPRDVLSKITKWIERDAEVISLDR
ncbi:MAG: ACP S-malonyltransferase [Nitrospirota bacterium]